MCSIALKFQTIPIEGGLGCEIRGLNISDPANDSAFYAPRPALDEWGVLVLHTATVFDAKRYRRVMYRTTIMA